MFFPFLAFHTVNSSSTCRYKMTCEFTWPQHLMASDRDAVQTIINQHGFQDDVAYGNTKLFVRTPRTLFTLEQERATLIPILVLFLQKVCPDIRRVDSIQFILFKVLIHNNVTSGPGLGNYLS